MFKEYLDWPRCRALFGASGAQLRYRPFPAQATPRASNTLETRLRILCSSRALHRWIGAQPSDGVVDIGGLKVEGQRHGRGHHGAGLHAWQSSLGAGIRPARHQHCLPQLAEGQRGRPSALHVKLGESHLLQQYTLEQSFVKAAPASTTGRTPTSKFGIIGSCSSVRLDEGGGPCRLHFCCPTAIDFSWRGPSPRGARRAAVTSLPT